MEEPPAWDIGCVAQIDPATDALVGEWLSLPDVAGQLGIPAGRVKQLLRDRKLLAVTRPEGAVSVPAAFLDGHQIVKGLCGTLTLLFDCGFDDLEAMQAPLVGRCCWLMDHPEIVGGVVGFHWAVALNG